LKGKQATNMTVASSPPSLQGSTADLEALMGRSQPATSAPTDIPAQDIGTKFGLTNDSPSKNLEINEIQDATDFQQHIRFQREASLDPLELPLFAFSRPNGAKFDFSRRTVGKSIIEKTPGSLLEEGHGLVEQQGFSNSDHGRF
jgi:hypothetical protein